ncbi:ribonuclease D [Dysgonomonas sp. PH5-45]|uniref:3'-5' exonuclease n=1 Tax=unclassified Dysgonomonas TaxID=2630389 RepID=UPI0024743452|nr:MULTISPECIES: 3'-5' exonuclease [unclassified Dysgonomonas]MDH6354857.1 ribonuclease D [Dysgonomonas sp. PH5-45]MDH6387756.1 ribonuclease D [Dysgonomonas sp. PH5-37]
MVENISKEQVSELPVEVFPGRIIVIDTAEKALQAVQYLRQTKIIGFDSETKPSFQRGKSYKVSLIQLATRDTCFLFRLNLIDFPPCLAELLDDPEVQKIGLSLKDDFAAIRKRVKTFAPQNFIELQAFVKKVGIKELGLQRIYAILFSKRITKTQRLSNWEADVLTDAQKMYASVDAWACLKIYEKLNETPIN